MSVDVFQLRLLWHPGSLISISVSSLVTTPENPDKVLCFYFYFRGMGLEKEKQI